MKFKAGYLGLAIVMLALFGSVLSGLIFNVNQVERSTTAYNYVTDITGLFDITDNPQYIEYNPATNYTGYTNMQSEYLAQFPTGISFIESSVANNYRIPISLGETATGPSGTVNNSSSYPQIGNKPEYYTVFGDAVPDPPSGYATLWSRVFGFKSTTMYDWAIATFGDLSSYSKVEVFFTYPTYEYPVTRAVINTMAGMGINQISDSGITSIVINPDDLTFTDNRGSTYSLYDVVLTYGNVSQKTNFWNINDSQEINVSTSLSLSYTSTVTYAPTYAYMNPTAGVTLALRPDGQYFGTEWSNSTISTIYDNVIIDLLVKIETGGSLVISGGSPQSLITIDDSYRFPAVLVRLNKLTNTATLYPVTHFVNFAEYTVSTEPILTSAFENSNLDKLWLSCLYDGLPHRFSIVQTTVVMDDYDVVMVDPSINLADYWPDMTSYRYHFQSVALYGDSITINGVTYALNENESIIVNIFPERLTNFYISFGMDGHTYLTFNSSMRTYDLGETVDKVVSFTGIWYFNAGLYEGKASTEKVYEWAGAFSGSVNMIILTALAFMVIGTLVAKKMGYTCKMWDKVVLIVCAFGLLCMVGGFI